MTKDILFEVRGHAGFITLNRPKALNALTHDMAIALARQLAAWETDDHVRHVVIRGAGEKAFCAGGDIRNLYDAKQAGKTDGLSDFFQDEYRLNQRIKSYPKPYIALIDGIVMGGGVGVSVHGSHRVGTENMMFSMPEVGIGFFPDVGGTYFLPRMPKSTGIYCALSAGRLKQADALATGVLTHAVSREKLSELESALETAEDVDALLASFSADTGPAPLMERAEQVDRIFGLGSVGEILSALEVEADEWATKTAATIRSRSPTSVRVAFEQMQRGAKLDFTECMKLEFRIVNEVLRQQDFYEGVRAVLLDRDQSPNWQPATLEEVDTKALEAYFEEPDCGDLTF
ncbi:3-hydroxyisobutyryl-CoA hydrolase [Roseibium sp. TrichSKD4]|uniref:enoyl-CoA hydratase/isomerase family protein n=1 Tax=Roseibium sp. TrichSKD4 TaxID=744980 RepID=UPI0001E576B1|nr:3-hydroxyisobutyryl-CoA hydrolase [Roseibium sp. TrichSKD4]